MIERLNIEEYQVMMGINAASPIPIRLKNAIIISDN